MPKVRQGEKRKKYVPRCIPVVMAEGKTPKQAVGQCEGMYDSKWGMKKKRKRMHKETIGQFMKRRNKEAR